MTTRRVRAIVSTIAITSVAVGVGLSGAVPASAATAAPKTKVSVTVGDNFYKPVDLEVAAGTKVTWKNQGKILHNVTAVKGKFGTKALNSGSTYSFRFKKPGTYDYYCSFHGSPTGGQRGSVTVVAAGTSPATPTTTSTAPTAG